MPAEIFESHYVRETRDPASRVTCPMIIHNKCSKCGKNGHFATSCRVSSAKPKPSPVIKKSKIVTSNTFDFGSESEEEPSKPVEPVEVREYKRAFPTIVKRSWADMDSDSDSDLE